MINFFLRNDEETTEMYMELKVELDPMSTTALYMSEQQTTLCA